MGQLSERVSDFRVTQGLRVSQTLTSVTGSSTAAPLTGTSDQGSQPQAWPGRVDSWSSWSQSPLRSPGGDAAGPPPQHLSVYTADPGPAVTCTRHCAMTSTESSQGPCAVASVLTGPRAIGHVPLVYRGGSCCWKMLRTCPKSPTRSSEQRFELRLSDTEAMFLPSTCCTHMSYQGV